MENQFIPLPLRWGRVGVNRFGSPSPLSLPARGREIYYGVFSKINLQMIRKYF
jgi:hypothetical protein